MLLPQMLLVISVENWGAFFVKRYSVFSQHFSTANPYHETQIRFVLLSARWNWKGRCFGLSCLTLVNEHFIQVPDPSQRYTINRTLTGMQRQILHTHSLLLPNNFKPPCWAYWTRHLLFNRKWQVEIIELPHSFSSKSWIINNLNFKFIWVFNIPAFSPVSPSQGGLRDKFSMV